MPLSSSLQVNTGEEAIHGMVQGWHVDLGQMHICHLLSTDTTDRSFVDYWKFELSGKKAIDAAFGGSGVY